MAEPIQEIKFDPISLEGMDNLLSDPELRHPGSDKPAPDLTDPDVAHWWTLPEATTTLHVNERTLRRWIKSGKIEALKVQGTYGDEWRIKPDSQISCPPVTVSPDKPDPDPIRQGGPDSPDPKAELLETKIRLTIMERENQQLKQQLQGATFRNGYLEAQIEGRDREIKLLTDSQQKRGWWARFASWFVTGR